MNKLSSKCMLHGELHAWDHRRVPLRLRYRTDNSPSISRPAPCSAWHALLSRIKDYNDLFQHGSFCTDLSLYICLIAIAIWYYTISFAFIQGLPNSPPDGLRINCFHPIVCYGSPLQLRQVYLHKWIWQTHHRAVWTLASWNFELL